jgi:2-polyprenyl-6-methoxyphenol hydroxylase-like FAD-dependent oxidoreductase
MSPYPFLLIVEQGKHEAILHQFIKQFGHQVGWQTELKSFTQNAAGIVAQVAHADGSNQEIQAKYLVGCDGAKSLVRHSLGLTFSGSTFERTFYVADVQIKWEFPHDMLIVFRLADVFLPVMLRISIHQRARRE